MVMAATEGRGCASERGTVCICVCGGTLQVRGRSAARNVMATQQLAGEVEVGSCLSSAAEMEVMIVVVGRRMMEQAGLVWTEVKNWVVVERAPRDVGTQLRAACEQKGGTSNLTRLGRRRGGGEGADSRCWRRYSSNGRAATRLVNRRSIADGARRDSSTDSLVFSSLEPTATFLTAVIP